MNRNIVEKEFFEFIFSTTIYSENALNFSLIVRVCATVFRWSKMLFLGKK